jgi:hypothetical protein
VKHFLALARFGLCAVLISAAITLNAQIIITFDGPNHASSSFSGINAWGEVSGSYQDASGTHGFVRELDGRFVTFDVPGSTGLLTAGIGVSGDVIGYTDGPTYTNRYFTELTRGFIRHRNGKIDLFNGCFDPGPAGPTTAWAYPKAINDKGSIIGNCDEYVEIDFFRFGFLQKRGGTTVRVGQLDPNGYTMASVINSKDQVAGWYRESGLYPEHGFITQPGGVGSDYFDVFPDADTPNFGTRPTAINTKGDIAGAYTTNSDWPSNDATYQAFLRNSYGSILTFEVPNSLETYPLSISERGVIVGTYADTAGSHGFLRQIDGTIDTFDVPIPDAKSISFIAVSTTGLILGSYTDQGGGVHGFIFVPLWFLQEK